MLISYLFGVLQIERAMLYEPNPRNNFAWNPAQLSNEQSDSNCVCVIKIP